MRGLDFVWCGEEGCVIRKSNSAIRLTVFLSHELRTVRSSEDDRGTSPT